MAQLPNPNDGKPFDEVRTDMNGDPLYGIRGGEIVHIPSGTSNVQYWKPEVVMNPEGCEHELKITDVGNREIECSRCHWATTFHVGQNYFERDGKPYFTFRGVSYPLS